MAAWQRVAVICCGSPASVVSLDNDTTASIVNQPKITDCSYSERRSPFVHRRVTAFVKPAAILRKVCRSHSERRARGSTSPKLSARAIAPKAPGAGCRPDRFRFISTLPRLSIGTIDCRAFLASVAWQVQTSLHFYCDSTARHQAVVNQYRSRCEFVGFVALRNSTYR